MCLGQLSTQANPTPSQAGSHCSQVSHQFILPYSEGHTAKLGWALLRDQGLGEFQHFLPLHQVSATAWQRLHQRLLANAEGFPVALAITGCIVADSPAKPSLSPFSPTDPFCPVTQQVCSTEPSSQLLPL